MTANQASKLFYPINMSATNASFLHPSASFVFPYLESRSMVAG